MSRMRITLFSPLLTFAVVLIFSSTTFGQSTATVQGAVTDSKGAVVPNATVVVRNKATSIERTTQTDSDGNYQIAALPVGTYAIEVRASGFKTQLADQVALQVAQTVVQNFLLSQAERLGATYVFFDKDRGAEIFVRAAGGTYLTLRNGIPTGCAPLKALELTPANLSFLGELVRKLVTPDDRPLTVIEEERIDSGLRALGQLRQAERSFGTLRAFLGQQDREGIGARLERWCRGAPFGWVLDGDHDASASTPGSLVLT